MSKAAAKARAGPVSVEAANSAALAAVTRSDPAVGEYMILAAVAGRLARFKQPHRSLFGLL
jgi:hypothetical protein